MKGEKKIRRPNRNTSRDCAGEADGDPTALSHQCPSREWSSNRTPERVWGGQTGEHLSVGLGRDRSSGYSPCLHGSLASRTRGRVMNDSCARVAEAHVCHFLLDLEDYHFFVSCLGGPRRDWTLKNPTDLITPVDEVLAQSDKQYRRKARLNLGMLPSPCPARKEGSYHSKYITQPP